MLREIGGPAALTSFARSLGDEFTRLDGWEVELNEALSGNPRDTTTPAAMLKNLQRLIIGNVLSETSRQRLTDWMLANKPATRDCAPGYHATGALPTRPARMNGARPTTSSGRPVASPFWSRPT